MVSIVVPCFNESAHIEQCIKALTTGTYKDMEILIVDGGSTDSSVEIIKQIKTSDDRVHLLFNPSRITPISLNIGIQASKGEYIAITSAHSIPASDWVEANLTCLEHHPHAIAVGGALQTMATGLWGIAISMAMSSPFGVGNARFRIGGTREETTDTVVFGCFRTKAFEKYGLFDEALATNQDDEFNLRLIHHGEQLVFSPYIKSIYFSRATLQKVIIQYWRYGFFKFAVLYRNKRIGSLRQLAPSLAVLAFVLLLSLSLMYPAALTFLCALFIVYFFLGILTIFHYSAKGKISAWLIPAVVLAIHTSYGIGFLAGIIAYPFMKIKSRIPQMGNGQSGNA